MTLTLTTNGRINGCRDQEILLARLLGAALEHGPWIMFEREMSWCGHNIVPHERQTIPPSAIVAEYVVSRKVPGCFPENGVVLVLNTIPVLQFLPVAEWDEIDVPPVPAGEASG